MAYIVNMPIHDWTRVKAGIFHDFHHEWITTIKHALNQGILPPSLYAMAEQLASGLGPDVLTLERPSRLASDEDENTQGGIALAQAEPKVSFRARTEADVYAAKANRIAIRHVSDHRVVAVVEIVSPGNKSTWPAIRTFAEKAVELLRGGVHLLVIDLFPPGARDPNGIHKVIWDGLDSNDFRLPADRQLTMASYTGGVCQEAFVEPAKLSGELPHMPLFISAEVYVLVPLEQTYRAAFAAVPPFWRDVLETDQP